MQGAWHAHYCSTIFVTMFGKQLFCGRMMCEPTRCQCRWGCAGQCGSNKLVSQAPQSRLCTCAFICQCAFLHVIGDSLVPLVARQYQQVVGTVLCGANVRLQCGCVLQLHMLKHLRSADLLADAHCNSERKLACRTSRRRWHAQRQACKGVAAQGVHGCTVDNLESRRSSTDGA